MNLRDFFFFSNCLKCSIVHVEEDAKENRNYDYYSSQWKWANGLLTHLILWLTHKCLLAFCIHVWDKCLSACTGSGRRLYIWQWGSGAFDCVVLLLFLCLILFQIWKQQGWHPFCNVWYFKISNVTYPLALWMNLCILWMQRKTVLLQIVDLNKNPCGYRLQQIPSVFL